MIDDQPPKTRKELEKKTRLDTRQNGKKSPPLTKKYQKYVGKKNTKKKRLKNTPKKLLNLEDGIAFFKPTSAPCFPGTNPPIQSHLSRVNPMPLKVKVL